MRRDVNTLFLAVFIAMVLAAAGLILSIPPLFGPHEPYQVWVTGVLGGLAAILAAGMLYLLPRYRRASGGGADE